MNQSPKRRYGNSKHPPNPSFDLSRLAISLIDGLFDDKPTVSFGEYDAVFDSDNPHQSDMIYDPKDGDENNVPALEILDEQGTSLSEGLDFDDLDNKEGKSEDLGTDDYESLN